MGAARGDLTRVAHPRHLLTCVGLMPAADATGARRRQGALTNAGHRHARRVRLEGAWAYRYPAPVRRHVQRRLEQPPKALQDLRWTAHVRLCTRSRRVIARGKHATQVVGALARELMGCMGAMAKQVPLTPSSHHRSGECTQSSEGFRRPCEAAPPRCGALRDGVTRLQETLGPRPRQAPDGRQSGGTTPRRSAGSPVASDWLRLFPCTKEKNYHADLKPLCPTLDIGSHINVWVQGRAACGASPGTICWVLCEWH
jgi:Transposase IS116/IS110/IS902 family